MTYTVYIVGSIRTRIVVQGTDAASVERLIVQELYNKMAENGTKQQVFYTIADQRVKASGTVKWGHMSGGGEHGCGPASDNGVWYKDNKSSDFAMERYNYYAGHIHSVSHSIISPTDWG